MTNRKQNQAKIATLVILLGLGTAQIASASELIYYPLNPSFGGNPLNGQVLLNSALATNKHTDPNIDEDRYGFEEKTPIEQFNETLERSLISRLAASASSKIVDINGNFIPGTVETQNFTITVADQGSNMLSISTTDRLTGATTVFEVSKR